MPAERHQRDGPRLIRPLLEVPSAVIALYAQEHSLTWVEDESNSDLRYRRNYLRHSVMPRIEGQFPGAAAMRWRVPGATLPRPRCCSKNWRRPIGRRSNAIRAH
jgi:tRNA(Ile)-lysidine synthase TilS/MesJ